MNYCLFFNPSACISIYEHSPPNLFPTRLVLYFTYLSVVVILLFTHFCSFLWARKELLAALLAWAVHVHIKNFTFKSRCSAVRRSNLHKNKKLKMKTLNFNVTQFMNIFILSLKLYHLCFVFSFTSGKNISLSIISWNSLLEYLFHHILVH